VVKKASQTLRNFWKGVEQKASLHQCIKPRPTDVLKLCKVMIYFSQNGCSRSKPGSRQWGLEKRFRSMKPSVASRAR